MNVDFMISNTPASARKLLYTSKIMKLDLDPLIIAQAEHGLLQFDLTSQALPGRLVEAFDNNTLALCQHAADHNYRFVMGASYANDAMLRSLIAALTDGSDVLIFCKHKENTKLWLNLLKHYDVPFSYRKNKDSEIDNARVLLCEQEAIDHKLLNGNRHRVAIKATSLFHPKELFFNINSLFNQPNDEYPYTVHHEFHREFPKFINVFHIDKQNLDKQALDAFKWWEDYTVQSMLTQMYPGVQVAKTFTQQAHIQNELLNMGFILRSPNHLAKLIGVHLDYLT